MASTARNSAAQDSATLAATAQDPNARPATWKLLLAFAIIYLVWGSTFLAIRIGVREVPPFLLAGIRFFVAGSVLFLWMRVKRTPLPTRREWLSAALVAVLIFVGDYGLVFWAERRVPSGLTAVMLATIPLFMALSEIIFLRTQRLTARLALALLVGLGGVAVLVSRSLGLAEEPINSHGAIALVIAACSWSSAAVLLRKLPLPASKPMSSAAQMLVGGVWLTIVSAVLGEFRGFDFRVVSRGAWFALAYLIVAGSIIAYTAYVWLLHHESPTKVGTYAYVNPVVAVVLGYFLAGESVGPRTLLGTLLVLVSVIVITTTPAKKPVPARLEEAPQPAE
jgi:drug/metabolite transporter (DMT)-like permease